jgi:hypothetical protein
VAAQTADPTLTALATLLADAHCAEQQPSLGRRIVRQLALLADLAGARLGTLLGSGEAREPVRAGGPEAALADPGAATIDQPPPMPRLPLQPPGPMLTLDPTLGTIVASDGSSNGPPAQGGGPGGVGVGGVGDGSAGGRGASLVPSSWVPVTGAIGRAGAAGRAGALRLLGAIDRLLERTRLTRAQLVVLTFLAPFVVAFLIDAVASMLDGS